MTSRPILIALFALFPTLVLAAPLTYEVQSDSSSLNTDLETSLSVSAPGFGSVSLAPGGIVDIPIEGSAVIDTGLPGALDDTLQMNTLTLGADAGSGNWLVSFGPETSNLDPGGQEVSLTMRLRSITVEANDPFSTNLVATGDSQVFDWGPVDVESTVTVTVQFEASVAGLASFNWGIDEPLTLDDIVIPFEGTFSGTEPGTELVIDPDILDDILYEFSGNYSIVSYEGSLNAKGTTLYALATNSTPLPEPSAALSAFISLLTLGFVGVLRRRMAPDRRRSA